MSFINKLKKLRSKFFQRENYSFPVEATNEEINLLKLCMPFSMTSEERMYATLSAVKYIVNNKIPGDFIECGVWQGGNSMIMAKTLMNLGEYNRNIYLFDTFEGMTSPTGVDIDINGSNAEKLLKAAEKKESNNIWCLASLVNVKENMSSTGYPFERFHFIQGDVLETLTKSSNIPQSISLLRLDTDWYESTKMELEILFPRLVVGGICIIDDYGHWKGARKAVDEFLAIHKIFPLLHVTDYTGRVFIKNQL